MNRLNKFVFTLIFPFMTFSSIYGAKREDMPSLTLLLFAGIYTAVMNVQVGVANFEYSIQAYTFIFIVTVPVITCFQSGLTRFRYWMVYT